MGVSVKPTKREAKPLDSEELKAQKAKVKAALTLLDDPRHRDYRRIMWWCDEHGHDLAWFCDHFGISDFLEMCGLGDTPVRSLSCRGAQQNALDAGLDLPTFIRENTGEILDRFEIPSEEEFAKALDAIAGIELERDRALDKARQEETHEAL